MTISFTYEPLAQRILFGAGKLAELPLEVNRLGISRPLVLTTAGQASRGDCLLRQLGDGAKLFSGAAMHTPINVTDAALEQVALHGADGLVAFGGGSATGLAKAIALRTDLPQIVIPTTYAGSEVTPVLGETRGGVKTTQRSLAVLPEVVLYDPDLTVDLPATISITSGLNAIAHAAEALYARDINPVIELVAKESLRALIHALPLIAAEPADRAARGEALYGAWMAGTCLGAVGMSLHHKLCHILGGTFNLPHAETHSIVLPHALAYNLAATPSARAVLAQATGFDDPARELQAFSASIGAPLALRDLGMDEGSIGRAADLATQSPYWNPRPVDREGIRALLGRAWSGDAVG